MLNFFSGCSNLKFDEIFGILVQFPFRMHVLNCSVTDIFVQMQWGFLKRSFTQKLTLSYKLERAIILEISGQIIKKTLDSVYLSHKDHIYVLTILNNCYDHH